MGVMILLMGLAWAAAEETPDGATGCVWVMCKPGSYVNVRYKARKTGAVIGRVECGEKLWTDGKVNGQFLHLVGLTMESGDGWIRRGYVVEDEPAILAGEANGGRGERYLVNALGRVALRRTVNGARRAWAKSGSNLRVLVMSDTWSLTNRGFIRTEFLEADPE